MGPLTCLLYMSHATRELGAEEIGRLLDSARRRNEAEAVTGALLHYGGRFVQVLEGEPEAVERCFARIAGDTRHDRLTRLHSAPCETRRFPDWSMRYVGCGAQPDRAVGAFLDQLELAPAPDHIRQAITLLQRLAGGGGSWQVR